MCVDGPQVPLCPRTRLLIAGAAALASGLLALGFITIPAWKFLAQISLYSPFGRLSIIVKVFSPLICFVLAGGWTWIFLWIGGNVLLPWVKSSRTSFQQEILLRPRIQLPSRQSEKTMPEQVLKEEPIAVPPLFQLDPTQPEQIAQLRPFFLPVTPPPAVNPAWSIAPSRGKQKEESDGEESEVTEGESIQATAAEHFLRSAGVDVPEQQNILHTDQPEKFSLRSSPCSDQAVPPVAISLLKRVSVRLLSPDGTTREVKLRRGENGIRLILLAYIAWRQGEPVDRDKLLTYVIARGRRRDMNTDQLNEVFDAAKKYLREDLKRAINEMNRQAGRELIAEKSVDFFSNEPGFYWLHPSCRVIDLAEIEKDYQTIQLARKDGLLDEKLDGSLPEWVVEACQNLIRAYSGDFLEELIAKFPDEFGLWVREPFTCYRDRYLDALWIMATYESALGRNFFDEQLTAAQNEEQRRHHIARAAQIFYDYALYALNSKWDQKLKFAYRANKDGERVIMAPRALRRCVVELGKLGKTDTIDQVYLAFKERMNTLSEGNWKPDKETESDVAEARRQTSAYRFSAQLPARQDAR